MLTIPGHIYTNHSLRFLPCGRGWPIGRQRLSCPTLAEFHLLLNADEGGRLDLNLCEMFTVTPCSFFFSLSLSLSLSLSHSLTLTLTLTLSLSHTQHPSRRSPPYTHNCVFFKITGHAYTYTHNKEEDRERGRGEMREREREREKREG